MTGAEPAPDPIVRRPGDARRRLFLIDLDDGGASEVGPPDLSVWEVAWDGDDRRRRARLERSLGLWLVSGDRRAPRPRRPDRGDPVRARLAAGGPRARAGCGSVRHRGLRERPGLLSGSIRIIDLASGGTTDPWPDLQTVGLASWAVPTRSGTPVSTAPATRAAALARRAPRRAVADDAFIGDAITTPAAITADAADVWTTHEAHGVAPELARFDDARSLDAPDLVQRPHRRGPRLPRRAHGPLDGEGASRSRDADDPPGAEGPFPTIVCVHGGPTWSWGAYFSDSEPNAVLLASAGYACLLPNPRGSIGRGHAFAQAVIGDSGGVDYRDIMAGVDT